MNIEELELLGLKFPQILLPAKHIDMQKWAVIACDQFTQNHDYWEAVRKGAAGSASTINLILPEAQINETFRIKEAQTTMRSYLSDGTLVPAGHGCMYVERSTRHAPMRCGIVLAIDLEQYDWHPKSRLPIRSTEGTLPERLPARMAIRECAAVETSHVIILINDEEDTIISSLAAIAKTKTPLYSTRLGNDYVDSGSITGWFVEAESAKHCLVDGLKKLSCKARARYGSEFLFAVGDGNHSLAAAKCVWEEYKASHSGTNLKDHPARWALVEVENLYDPCIRFEPIHRILFGIDASTVVEALSALPGSQSTTTSDKDTLSVTNTEDGKRRIGIVAGESCTVITFEAGHLVTVELQPVLDKLVSRGSIDYIHGKSDLFRLLEKEQNSVGLLLPPVVKSGFFDAIAAHGHLPHKSFSMGEAEEKRFYIECRRLFD